MDYSQIRLTNETECLYIYKTVCLVTIAGSVLPNINRVHVNGSMSKRSLPSVTGAELKMLETLWECGEATIGELRDLVYPEGGESKFATVQKLLSRLVAKRLVGRRKDSSNWIFKSLIARDDLIGGELRRVADRLGGNSMTPLLTHLVETGELTAKERAHLRRLLDEPPKASHSKRKHKS
jgi:BlaI family transcriptional regulator, penicillinase repressor